MTSLWCTECRTWHDNEKHLPLYRVHITEFDEEEGLTIRAQDAQIAAERACEQEDRSSAVYSIITNGGTPRVSVKDAEGVVKHFSITAEGVPTYYATEIVPENEEREG